MIRGHDRVANTSAPFSGKAVVICRSINQHSNEAPKGKTGNVHFYEFFVTDPVPKRNDEVKSKLEIQWKKLKVRNNQQSKVTYSIEGRRDFKLCFFYSLRLDIPCFFSLGGGGGGINTPCIQPSHSLDQFQRKA